MQFYACPFYPKLSFPLPKPHDLRTFVFLRTCQVTGEQEQSGAKTVWTPLVRRGLQESERVGQSP